MKTKTAQLWAKQDQHQVDTTSLEDYLLPKKPQTITVESLHKSGRGIAYRKPAFAYLFVRNS